ncbi:hypothetical protein MWU75_13310 [Ornithinimicrobium sp. F0845]|uniref:alpha/beta hydrolase n=1 Tax=Ornithinimicrobium sp. F0845 TaxID=2926412 RepID=UPI001FF3CEF8|nr:acyl-CoA thioester hydrolase/BAAT C-terminal domain-containing protein [Ornithinimicrobium sp. F0845]MCK0113122.1 hypothetical protein [Ornithinimicrobium sp. F0845]
MEITRTRVTDQGLTGLVCSPARGPAPGVLLVGGSEGGRHDRDAALLAAEGFTVLSLSYFADEGVTPVLVDIPLELFAAALDHLESVSAGGGLGMVGGSRGGEATLLVASREPRIRAAVSIAGSGLLTQGIDFTAGVLPEILSRDVPSWTVGGEPLPYLPYANIDRIQTLVDAGQPVPLALGFPPVPTDPAQLELVSIPVERVSGRILSVCGEDDQSWPSAAYTQVAVDRMAAAGRATDIEHIVLPGVGHPIAGPPGDPFASTLAPGPGTTFEMGGTAEANTTGRARAWELTLAFLRRELQ